MPLPKEFQLPESLTADFWMAHNIRIIYGITIAHMDAEVFRHSRPYFPNALLPNMLDLESSLQALAISFEQAQWWCTKKQIPIQDFLTNQALNDVQRKDVKAIIELGTHALEKYPPTPEDHQIVGPLTLNQIPTTPAPSIFR